MRLIKSTCERIVKWYTERSQFTVMEWLFIVGVAGWLLFKLYELVLL